MLLIDPIRYYQLCKLAEQSRMEQEVLHDWLRLLVLIILLLTAALVYFVLTAHDQAEELRELKQIIKEDTP